MSNPLRVDTCRSKGYMQVDRIESGTTCVVYCYVKNGLYAIKHIPKTKAFHTCIAEMNILSQIHHPNLLHIIEIFSDENEFHIVYPYGKEIREVLCRTRDTRQIVQWMMDIASAVHYLHTLGYSHNDIKPDNVLIIDNRAVLIDLGLVYPIDKSPTISGSVHYRCPEFLYLDYTKEFSYLHVKTYSGKYADLWALGCLYTYMLTYDHLFLKRKRHGDLERHVVNNVLLYLTNQDSYLDLQLIPYEYMGLVKDLVNPIPERRPTLDNLDLFFKTYFLQKGYTVDTITATIRNYEEIPIQDEIYTQVLIKIDPTQSIKKHFSNVYPNLLQYKKPIDDPELFCLACLYLVAKCSNSEYDLEDYVEKQNINIIKNIIEYILIQRQGRIVEIV